MPGPVAAIAGAGLVSAGASIFGASKASKSAKDAAKAQTKATQSAMAAQERALERQIGLQEPFRQVGINALAKYPATAEYTPFGMQQFQADPGYGFRMSEGLKALERSASARGLLQSGGTLKDIARYGQDLASQEYQNAFQRYLTERQAKLAPLEYQIGLGQAAASGQAANVGTTAGQMSELTQALGNIAAQRNVAQGNIMSSLASGLGGIAGQAAQGYIDYQANLPYQNYLRSITPATSSVLGSAPPAGYTMPMI